MTEGIETDTIPNSVLRRARADMQHRVAVIIAHEGGLDGAVLLPGASVIVGRGEEATLQIDDKMLSRAHARFELAGNGVAVEDLGSTNGLYYQSRQVHRIELEIGEEIILGRVRAFVQRLGPGEAPPTSKRAPGAEAPRETTGGTGGTGSGGEEPPVAGARMTALLAEARRVANAQISVLLRGETGTGKEVLARFLHEHSPRRRMPMLSVSCAALPEQLLVSTLFGHERGAFTGAVQQRKGLFEEAHGGTLFLDEVGELSPAAQAALLRVLESRQMQRVGSARDIDVDVRLISATHRNLEAMCAKGQFRSDLLHRLNGVTLRIPPLREREDEIEPLALRFVRDANRRNGRSVQGIEAEALEALRRYRWPGNVRELRNVIEGAVVMAAGARIGVKALPQHVRAAAAGAGAAAGTGADAAAAGTDAAAAAVAAAAAAAAAGTGSIEDLEVARGRLDAAVLQGALLAANGNKAKAARILKIPERTLHYRLRALGLKDEGD